MFFTWLVAQVGRPDGVGLFALLATLDPLYPRNANRLYVLLRYCGPHVALRGMAKASHAEWRKAR
jgi:hypothetical protein